jgi:hypothetical protein
MAPKLRAKGPCGAFVPYLKNLQDFDTRGSLFGVRVTTGSPLTGRLSDEYRASVVEADYIVYSYGTPIAWHTPGGWFCPDESYSLTTSAHQHKIKEALAELTRNGG